MAPKPTQPPFGKPNQIKCPQCGARNWEARALQYDIWRQCRECGKEWSGGIGVAKPDPSGPPSYDVFIPGVPVPPTDPEEDKPDVQFTGASFRDPSKNYDGGED